MRKWALVSVFDKRGIVEFARALVEAGYGILSTGGTARHLLEAGIAVTPVEEYTGFPEMMDGRVKTLHPKIHGGILGLRDVVEHVEKMEQHGIDRIDVVVTNLYPFEQTIARPGVSDEEAIEMIDIGGPSMLRAAAKNHAHCLPVIDPDDYGWVAQALKSPDGLSMEQRRRLAAKVFAFTAAYDKAIAAYLSGQSAAEQPAAAQGDDWPARLHLTFAHKQSLRYGENPHQRAHFYVEELASAATIAMARQLQGKELSYNNIMDADACLSILRGLDEFGQPACVAVKHTNPCGVALGDTIHAAYQRAYEADPVSIFGGIVAVNRAVDAALAEQLKGLFLEIVIAPAYTDEALQVLAAKKNLRLLEVDMGQLLWRPGDLTYRRVSGGLLVQEVDLAPVPDYQVVTERAPTDDEWQALRFAWRVVKYVKSNAIVLATATHTLGIGAGQMNRVGSAKIAIEQAGARAPEAVLASDAFFPMRDTVDEAAKAGIRAIVQPGGSIRDAEVIAAANEHGIAMVFTGYRHFNH